ncbi:hypothetical protein PUN28_014499 [Cardiocondyla obscurior]|uniref:Uncharacterized protein n=1 Tax=Cardiocondyla obscurior TaxID=286306 RepID=A0AAW2F223_9HYME
MRGDAAGQEEKVKPEVEQLRSSFFLIFGSGYKEDKSIDKQKLGGISRKEIEEHWIKATNNSGAAFCLCVIPSVKSSNELQELAQYGQPANKVANVGSSVPDKIPIQIGRLPSSRCWPDVQLPPLFKFHTAGTEIQAKSAEFLLDKTPKKFEGEETRRKMRGRARGERGGSVPN